MSMKINRRLSMRQALWAAAIAWTACFTTLPTFSATATLSGVTTNSCTYTTTSVDSLGNITVTCNTVPQPGQIAFAQSTYGASINDNSFQVQVNRNNGSVGAVGATVTATGGCTVNGGGTTPVAFADGISTPAALVVGTPGTATTCTLALSGATGGATLGGNATINVTDPTQPGVFSFAAAASSAGTGVTNHLVTIQRTGGSNGAYDVAFTAAPTGLTGYSATVSPIQFANGQTTATITVTTGTTGGTVLYTLTGAVPVAPNVTPTTLGTTVAHTVTVTSPSNCPANGVSPVEPGTTGTYQIGNLAPGASMSIRLPGTAWRVGTLQTVNTPQNFTHTFSIERCPGEFTATTGSGAVPCKKTGGVSGNTLDIVQAPTFAKCHWTPAERANVWYLNIRVDNCPTGSCQFYYYQQY